MIAVIKTGGKQYKVSEGETIQVEKLDVKKDDPITFGEVLLVGDEKGETTKLGTPFLEGASVTGIITSQGRYKKVDVIKYKPKIRYRRKIGHRQAYTEVRIEKITTS